MTNLEVGIGLSKKLWMDFFFVLSFSLGGWMEACFTSHKKSENSYSLGVGVEDVYLLFLKPIFWGGKMR